MDIVMRLEDMSASGHLKLCRQDDGDIMVCVRDEYGDSATVEFCTSGTRSHHTLLALADLFRAMEKDQQEHPHG